MGQAGRWILVLLLALAAGFGAYRLASRGAPSPEAGASPPAASAPASPASVIPERRPEMTLADRHGKPRALSEWNGKPQVINFWATWCAPCRREIPMLNALAKDGAWPEIALIGIAIDFREDVLQLPRDDADRLHGPHRRTGWPRRRPCLRRRVPRPALHRLRGLIGPHRHHPCRRVAPAAGRRHPVHRPRGRCRHDRPEVRPGPDPGRSPQDQLDWRQFDGVRPVIATFSGQFNDCPVEWRDL